MIEVINLMPYQEKIPNTYGYISLGGFELPKKFDKTLYSLEDYFKAICKVDNKEFDLIIVHGRSNQAIVLGDLTNIPGNLLIDQEELYHELKEKIEELHPFSDDHNPWFWTIGDKTMEATFSVLGTPGVQGTTASNVLSTKNYTVKVNYGTKS